MLHKPKHTLDIVTKSSQALSPLNEPPQKTKMLQIDTANNPKTYHPWSL